MYFTTIRKKSHWQTHLPEQLLVEMRWPGPSPGRTVKQWHSAWGWGGVSPRGHSGTRPVPTTAERLWPHDAAILFLGMHAMPVCTSVHQKMLTRMFTAALLTLALNWTQPYAHRENGDAVPQWTILQQRRWTIYPQEHGQISYAQCRMEITRYKRVCTV